MITTDIVPVRRADRETSTVRRLAVTWQHPLSREITPVGMLEFDGARYRFSYVKGAESAADFRPLLGFPDLYRTYESRSLFPLFAQRVMDPRRPDYERYVHRLGLPADATPWEQMGRSRGARQGDLLQLFPEPARNPDGTISCTFLVHGIRHIPERLLTMNGQTLRVTASELEATLSRLGQGDPLRLVREPFNPVNSHAVIVATGTGFPLGWVPNLLLDDLDAICAGHPELATVEIAQVNGPDAPAHLRLLAKLTADPAPAYLPFAGPTWQRLGHDA